MTITAWFQRVLGRAARDEAGARPAARASERERSYEAPPIDIAPNDPILYYFQRVLGERRDLTLRPHAEMSYRAAAGAWAREHTLSERPIAFLTLEGTTRDHLASVDSVAVTPGRWIYVTREPLLEAASGQVAR